MHVATTSLLLRQVQTLLVLSHKGDNNNIILKHKKGLRAVVHYTRLELRQRLMKSTTRQFKRDSEQALIQLFIFNPAFLQLSVAILEWLSTVATIILPAMAAALEQSQPHPG